MQSLQRRWISSPASSLLHQREGLPARRKPSMAPAFARSNSSSMSNGTTSASSDSPQITQKAWRRSCRSARRNSWGDSEMQLKSYVNGQWREGRGEGALLRDATTGAVVARASTDGIDFRG